MPIDTVEQSLTPETILRRYMSFAKFVSLMQTRSIFFPSLTSFDNDDPHEGSSTLLDELHQNGTFAALARLANVDFPRTGNEPLTEDQMRRQADIVAESERERFVETVFGSIPILADRSYKQIVRSQRQWLDVSCWHSNADESMAMWKIYGGERGESVCITTNVERLKHSLQFAEQVESYLGAVRYIDHQNDYFKEDHPLMPALHKRLPFSYEMEIRVIAWDKHTDPMQQRSGPSGRAVVVDLPKLVTGIRVSPTAMEWLQSAVQYVTTAVLPNLKVERSGLASPPLFLQ